MREAAEQAYSALHLESYARMDFILDKGNNAYCLEANTLPGMTPTSLLPQEAAVEGVGYADLCELIIKESLKITGRELHVISKPTELVTVPVDGTQPLLLNLV